MPLMVCVDCEKQHSDAAPACPNCGRPNMVAPVVASVPLPQGRYPQAPVGPRLACPACGSPDVKKLSLVYREGTAHIQTNTGGAIYGAGGGAVLGAHTSGSSRSLLSMGASPPVRKTMSSALGCLGALGVLMLLIAFGGAASVLFLLVGGGLLALVGMTAASNAKWNREEFPKLYAHWDATFLCTRCENRFVP